MLPKAVISVLVTLHLLQGTPSPTPTPLPTPTAAPQKLTASDKSNQNGISIPDLVYADLALQHELDHVSVYYFDDNPQNTISLNSEKSWDPASTIKLYIAMYAFDQASHGNISLDQMVTITDKNVAASQSFPGGYAPLEVGNTASVYELLDRMITQSSNTAYNTLLDLLGRQEVTKYIHDLGLINSSVGAKLNLDEIQQQYEIGVPGYGPNLVTANDYAKAFILIKGGRIPGSIDLYNILARQKFNSMIPALLPKNVTVAHKTGELDPYYHDGGIVSDAKRKYVLSVFSDMGSPNIVAHISDLIYTSDVNLIGHNQKSQSPTAEIDPPIDPLVLAGEPQNTSVLAANAQNAKTPEITATDLGIQASDLSSSLKIEQLPPVIIPVGSPLHFLVDLGAKIRSNLNPLPAARVNFEAQDMMLKLAEANDLLKKGHKDEANNILTDVDVNLAKIAKDRSVTGNASLQFAIDQVSETRFSILGSEISASGNTEDKVQLIKEVAKQARNTDQNVKPFVSDATKENTLSQTPIVGKVVNSTINSITIKTANGTEVTTPVDTHIKAREVGQDEPQVISVKEIAIGSTVALAGSTKNDIKPSFILTNISPDTANSTPVTVLKVNQDTNTMVITSGSGAPVQINLNSQTIIKGSDTAISLSEVKPGDVVVVHGQPVPAIPPATPMPSSSPLSSPSGNSSPGSPSNSGTNGPNNLVTPTSQTPGSGSPTLPSSSPSGPSQPYVSPTPVTTIPKGTASPTKTNSPISTTTPKVTTSPAKTNTPTATVAPKTTIAPAKMTAPTIAPKATTVPTVIKGSVIEVVQRTQPTAQPLPVKSTPNPVPAATPPPATKH